MKGCSPCTTGRGRPVGISRGRGGNSWRTCSGVGPHTSPPSGRPKPLAVVSEEPENPCPRPGWNSRAPFEAGAQDTLQQWQPQSRPSTAVVPLGMAAEQRWVHQELLSQACLLCFLNWFWSLCMLLCWNPLIRLTTVVDPCPYPGQVFRKGTFWNIGNPMNAYRIMNL